MLPILNKDCRKNILSSRWKTDRPSPRCYYRLIVSLGRKGEISLPNGGSDCCGTCWFNSKNKGEAGYRHAGDNEPDFCTIRNLAIENPFYTYCGNHPHRRSEKDRIPAGPVFVGDSSGSRKLWKPSPDSEEIRRHLLALLGDMAEQPTSEYPIGVYVDEMVVWQLGEFRDLRALEPLRRVSLFQADAKESGPFDRTRNALIRLAREALEKIEKSESLSISE